MSAYASVAAFSTAAASRLMAEATASVRYVSGIGADPHEYPQDP